MSQWKQHRTSLEEYQARQQDKNNPKHSPPTTDELRHMLRGIRWCYFNNCDVRKVGGIRFACGIGIHMNRYTAAVASHARFLALRVIPEGLIENNKGWTETGLSIFWEFYLPTQPTVLRPTNVARSIGINVIEHTPMWDELIIPDDGI
jgi:hypothetical protein